MKAIEIYEFAPGALIIQERSAIYPCFCALFRLLRDGALAHDSRFEKTLVKRFVQETKGTDSFHKACALAMSAQMKYRSGLPKKALEEFETMVGIHNVKDSREIHREYDIDLCALAYARTALWFKEMGDEENALRHCEFVIKMLDELQSNDPKEMYAILTPIMVILRDKQIGRAKKLFEDWVVKLAQGTALAHVWNMHLVLTIDNGSEIDQENINWALSDKNRQMEADQFYISLGLSTNTVAAEAALLLAQTCNGIRRSDMEYNRNGSFNHDTPHEGLNKYLLVDRGMALTAHASIDMKEDDVVLSTAADDRNRSVRKALHVLADEEGFNWEKGPAMRRLRSFENNSLKISPKIIGQTLQLKAKKTLPHQLLLSHKTVAFVGLTHDSLAKVFHKALAEEPRRKWSEIHIFFVADPLMANFQPWDGVANEKETQSEVQSDVTSDLSDKKRKSWQELNALLGNRSTSLSFYEITHHCSFFGSWFGWTEPGGYIHVR